MIDPHNPIKYDRTDSELEEWWLFSCVVAGKTALTQARALENFLNLMPGGSPFDKLRLAINNGRLLEYMQMARLGQYTRLHKCFSESVHLDLRTCTVADLEKITGIGPKTARMFILHSRPAQRVAALDTHILKHLKENGYTVPPTTPSSSKKYRELENAFLQLADEAGMDVSSYDLHVWKLYSRKPA